MMSFNIKNVDSGKEWSVIADTRDVYKWEKTHKGVNLNKLADGLGMTDLYSLAYLASTRTGQFKGSEDDFVDGHVLEFEEEEDAEPAPKVR